MTIKTVKIINTSWLEVELGYDLATSQEDLITWVSVSNPIYPFKWMPQLLEYIQPKVNAILNELIDLFPTPFIIWLPFTKLAVMLIDENGDVVPWEIPEWNFAIHGWYFFLPYLQIALRVKYTDLAVEGSQDYTYYIDEDFDYGQNFVPVHKVTVTETLGDIILVAMLFMIMSKLGDTIGHNDITQHISKEVIKTAGNVSVKTLAEKVLGAKKNTTDLLSIAASIATIINKLNETFGDTTLALIIAAISGTGTKEEHAAILAKVLEVLERIGIKLMLK